MKISALILPLVCAASFLSAAEHWPAFRGPNSSGVSASAKPPGKIGPDQPAQWVVDVPWSPSSPCVWGNRIFLTTFAEGKLETRALDRRNGKLLWKRAVPAAKLEEFHQTEGSPAASTPATDGRRVVSYFGSFGLICHDFNGRELWRHPLPLAETAGNFGSGTSPLLAGDLVVLNRDLARYSALLAVRLSDGRKVWETPRPDSPTSYGSPILWRHDGREEIVASGSLALKGYDVKSGAERWVVRGLCAYACTTPVTGDGLVFFAGWSPGKGDSPWPSWESTVEKQDKDGDGIISPKEFTNGPEWFKAQDIDGDGKLEREDWDAIGGLMKRGENVMVAVKPGGQGDVTATHVAWKFERGLPYVPSPLHYDGRVYLVKDGGMMSSFDARTGRAFYVQERLNALGNYYASPVAADGRIYVFSLDGKATVVKAGGDKPEILHQADFGERIAGTPALVGNRLYLRTQTKLYAFGR
jgi:outer membrane protein assembly factor BamB